MKYYIATYDTLFYEIDKLEPCPKCRKHPSQKFGIRHQQSINAPFAVCCGGVGCGFYVAGKTVDEAVEAWNLKSKLWEADK